MPSYLTLTPQPIYLSGSGGSLDKTQELWTAADVSGHDFVDLQLGVLAFAPGAAGTLTVKVLTGMTTEIDDASWVDLITFSTVLYTDSIPKWEVKSTINAGKMLRYLRWKATISGGGASTVSVVLWIRGFARSYGQPSAG